MIIAAVALAAAPSLAAGSSLAAGPSLAADDRRAILESLIAQDGAVARVGYRLATANRDLCPRTMPLAGVAIHAAEQYDPAYRPALAVLTGLDHGFALSVVVPDSPAYRAGLRADDRLLAIGDVALPEGGSGKADQAPVERAIEQLDRAMTRGGVSLRIARAGLTRTMTFHPATGCAVRFQVQGGTRWTAATDGRLISVRSAIVAAAADDAELAVPMAHELAHALFDHALAADGRMVRTGRVPPGGREERADRAGLYLLARAGFDPAAGERFWRRFGASHQLEQVRFGSYPTPRQRLRSAQAVAADIARRRNLGLGLWPDEYARPEHPVGADTADR